MLSDGGTASYALRFSAPDYRKAKVHATIPLRQNLLLMEQESARAFQDGWSTFVGNLQAKTTGVSVKLNRTGKDRWQVLGSVPATIDLEYTVVLGHDKFPDKWTFGYKQAAFGRDDYAFYTGKSLFIASPGLERCTIRFLLPSDWKVFSGWRDPNEAENTFVASDLFELWHAALVVGKPRVKNVDREGIRSTVVSRRTTAKKSVDLLAGTIGRLVPEASRMFGGTPHEKVLIVTDHDPEYSHEGGEAFNRSLLLIFQKPVSEENKPQWARSLTHELIHLWLGYTVRFQDEHREEWFLEGVTEYLSGILQARVGIITLDGLIGRLSENYAKYARSAGRVSLADAGAHKSNNIDLVYSGGMVVALALDSEVRSRSKGQFGLERILQEMYRTSTGGNVRYGIDKICEISGRATERDMQLFFDDYVNGLEKVELEDYSDALGLTVERGIVRPMPGEQGTRLRRSWIGEPVVSGATAKAVR